MAAPDIDTVREHVETGLTDPPLQRLIDDAYQEVVSRYGDGSQVTVTVRGGGHSLYPAKPIDVDESVTIVEKGRDGTTIGTLSSSEYRIMYGGRQVERLYSASVAVKIGRWAPIVELTYTPVDESDLRDRMVFDLVRLGVEYKGLKSEKVGDYSSTSEDYLKERERILMAINHRRGAWIE